MLNTGRLKQLDNCMCLTMRSRITELKHRKVKKRMIYDEITKKYGNQKEVQRLLFELFHEKLDQEYDLETIEKIIKKKLTTNKEKNLSEREPDTKLYSQLPNLKKTKKGALEPLETDEKQWATIVKYDTERFYQEEKGKIERQTENQRKMVKELDKQISEKQRKYVESVNQERFYDEMQKKSNKTAEINEKKYQKQVQNKLEREKEQQAEFLQISQKIRENNAKAAQEYEAKLIKSVKKSLISEEISKKAKKANEKNFYAQVITEHEMQKKKKQENWKKQAEEDENRLKEYSQMLKKQEEDRISQAKKVEESYQKNTNPHALLSIKIENNKRIQDDIELYRIMNFKESIERLQDDHELKKKVIDQENLKRFYQLQISNQEVRKNQEKKNEKEIVREWKKEAEEFKKFQTEKEMQGKKNRLKNAEFLKSQIKKEKNQSSFY